MGFEVPTFFVEWDVDRFAILYFQEYSKAYEILTVLILIVNWSYYLFIPNYAKEFIR